jgi:hypothetical protein
VEHGSEDTRRAIRCSSFPSRPPSRACRRRNSSRLLQRHGKTGKRPRREELRHRCEMFGGAVEVGGMKRKVGIAIDGVPQLSPLRFHHGVVFPKSRAASEGIIRPISGKHLMAISSMRTRSQSLAILSSSDVCMPGVFLAERFQEPAPTRPTARRDPTRWFTARGPPSSRSSSNWLRASSAGVLPVFSLRQP